MRITSIQRDEVKKLQVSEMNNGMLSYFSLQGGGKELNEDALLIADRSKSVQLLLVADGMGGHPGGDVASSIIIDTFRQAYRSSRRITLNAKLFATLDLCNQRVMEHPLDCGSTLCMALLQDHSIQFINVGDSLGLLLDAKGNPKYATVEENSTAMADEIEAETSQAFLLNYMGFERITYQVSPKMVMNKGDHVYMMSDGAHEYFEQGFEKDVPGFYKQMKSLHDTEKTDDATCIQFIKSI